VGLCCCCVRGGALAKEAELAETLIPATVAEDDGEALRPGETPAAVVEADDEVVDGAAEVAEEDGGGGGGALFGSIISLRGRSMV
jgi:hypothetical protein